MLATSELRYSSKAIPMVLCGGCECMGPKERRNVYHVHEQRGGGGLKILSIRSR